MAATARRAPPRRDHRCRARPAGTPRLPAHQRRAPGTATAPLPRPLDPLDDDDVAAAAIEAAPAVLAAAIEAAAAAAALASATESALA